MTDPRLSRAATVALAFVVALGLMAAPAFAHEERPVTFPAGTGKVPTYRQPLSSPRLVVCKPDSAERIAAYTGWLRTMNERLLAECGYEHIQAAVNAVEKRGTTIYVLPGKYREEPSRAAPSPECAALGNRHALSYAEQYSCPNLQQLVAIFGDRTPGDASPVCDSVRCDLQLEGTGKEMTDVILEGGYKEDGTWAKLNGIRSDRADGFYLRNITAQLFEFNSVYVLEQDGFVIDRALGRWNEEYGFLTFASDHGLYTDCEAHGNGDAGLYPGSASPLNGRRHSIEIQRCDSHHNALGYSGTAGDSVYAHDNTFHHNSAGVSMDSAFPGHPGLPQNHATFENNLIYSNNENYYGNIWDGTCKKKPRDRGHEQGLVCPAPPIPVGTGLLLGGGNDNNYTGNRLYDNWRHGFRQIWVPAPIRGENDLLKFRDTSHRNRYTGNAFGITPQGAEQPNGLDVWWDEQGDGNCWQQNTSSWGTVKSDPAKLPNCDRPSGWTFNSLLGNLGKVFSGLPCSEYGRDKPRPQGCDWFDTPQRPSR
ncbi:right-handed parallel beta-helix repeat-containing protein [Actinomadura sp. 9N407]|uniref:right-handed parallel beta-helix repeat-containing protein n=1 Tax=Actinomadura sp. 9N407 TaxID=3375154 RepID=UPI003793060C